jgi:hypothetical protein
VLRSRGIVMNVSTLTVGRCDVTRVIEGGRGVSSAPQRVCFEVAEAFSGLPQLPVSAAGQPTLPHA